MKNIILSLIFLSLSNIGYTQSSQIRTDSNNSQPFYLNYSWLKAKVAYLGDSITDKNRVGTKKVYWEFLQEWLGIESHVFAKSGHTWRDLVKQAEDLKNSNIEDLDAIIIFAGTNDYNSNTKMGSLYTETIQSTNHNGNQLNRKFRENSTDLNTFYGRINTVLTYLKTNFPKQQIIVMTPIHRGYAHFSDKNVQPDERFANGEGLYIDDYVNAIKSATQYWSVPTIDLFSIAGLNPLIETHAIYFAKKDTDLLHPNALGHEKLAKTIALQLIAIPAKF